MTNDPGTLLDALEETWMSTLEVARTITDDEWDTLTGCPGWSVKDNLSHIIALEVEFGGGDQVAVELPEGLEHVKGPIGEYMEQGVHLRRSRTGADVLAEAEEVLAGRLKHLRAMSDEEWAGQVRGPMGSQVDAVGFLGIRVFDCWAHEQDIRRAVGRPGGLDGMAAQISRDRALAGLGFVLGKKVGADEGASALVHLTGPSATSVGVVIEGGKGIVSQEAPASPAVTLTAPFDQFMALLCGRVDADRGSVSIEGDTDLGRRIVDNLAVTP